MLDFRHRGATLDLIGPEESPGSDESVKVLYGRLHTLDDTTSTIPPHLEELALSGAAGYAAMDWSGHAINSINTGGPDTWRHFLVWGQEKLVVLPPGVGGPEPPDVPPGPPSLPPHTPTHRWRTIVRSLSPTLLEAQLSPRRRPYLGVTAERRLPHVFHPVFERLVNSDGGSGAARSPPHLRRHAHPGTGGGVGLPAASAAGG